MHVDQLIGQPVGRAQVELLARLVVLPDRSAVHAGKLDGAGDDGGKHRLQIERRAYCLPDLAERLQLSHRPRQLAGPRLQLREQADILDRDHRLVGEGLEQLDPFVRETTDFATGHSDRANHAVFANHRHQNRTVHAAGAMRVAATACRMRVLLYIGHFKHGAVQDAPKVIGFTKRTRKPAASRLAPRAEVISGGKVNDFTIEPIHSRGFGTA